MNAKARKEYERLIAYILDNVSATTRRQAEAIARRMLAEPGGDLLDQMTVD